jgi:hypothetical protein
MATCARGQWGGVGWGGVGWGGVGWSGVGWAAGGPHGLVALRARRARHQQAVLLGGVLAPRPPPPPPRPQRSRTARCQAPGGGKCTLRINRAAAAAAAHAEPALHAARVLLALLVRHAAVPQVDAAQASLHRLQQGLPLQALEAAVELQVLAPCGGRGPGTAAGSAAARGARCARAPRQAPGRTPATGPVSHGAEAPLAGPAGQAPGLHRGEGLRRIWPARLPPTLTLNPPTLP